MTMLTVGALREMLERYDEDLPVVLAHQPSYPLQEEFAGVVLFSEAQRGEDDPGEYGDDEEEMSEAEELAHQVKERLGEEHADIVYLVASGAGYKMNPYAPRALWECV